MWFLSKVNCNFCKNIYFKYSLATINDCFICKNCINKFNKLNYPHNYSKFSILDIEKSLINNKSLREMAWDEEIEKSRKMHEEWKRKNQEKYNSFYSNLKILPFEISNNKIPKNSLRLMPKLTISTLSKNTAEKNYNDFIVIDTETTGLRPGSDEIIEISAIKFISGIPTECLSTLIKPKKEISDEVTNINNITNEMVKNSPNIQNAIEPFYNFIEDYNIVAYNTEFDIKFLYKNGLNFFIKRRKYFDVLPLCRKEFKDYIHLPNYKLDSICKYMGITRNIAHRATEDALVTGLIFNYIGNSIKK